LGPKLSELFSACETELIDMRSARATSLGPALELLKQLIDYRQKRLSAMRTHIVRSLGALRMDPRVGPGYRDLALALAGELGIGGEIGPESLSC
jgi:hypothetical protein